MTGAAHHAEAHEANNAEGDGAGAAHGEGPRDAGQQYGPVVASLGLKCLRRAFPCLHSDQFTQLPSIPYPHLRIRSFSLY